MEFRKKVRDKLFQRDFLANTIDERIAIALRAREESKDDQQEKSYEIMDVTPEEVEHAIRNHDTDYMLHGHTHRPAVHDLIVDRRAKQRIVLGDWEDKAWYVKWDDNGYELKSYTLLTWSIQVKVFIIERLVMPTIGWVNKLKSVF